MEKINFEVDTKYGVYRDALYLPNNHTYTSTEIEEMKKQRVDNWINIIENPPIAAESPFVEIDGVTYEKITIGGQIVLKPYINPEEQSTI